MRVGFENMFFSQNGIKKMEENKEWYVMRDLHRGHRTVLSYQELSDKGYETYTPTVKTPAKGKNGKTEIVERPFLPDLFFLKCELSVLKILTNTFKGKFQYRYKYGVHPATPITVPQKQMDDFIRANKESKETKFLTVNEIPQSARNSTVRIVSGPLQGVEGMLLGIRGTKRKRLIIELPHFLAISVYLEDEYVVVKELRS